MTRKTKYAMRDKFQKRDNLYTPVKLVDVIVPFIIDFWGNWEHRNKRRLVVWCPFDTEESEFVREFRKLDRIVEVVHSHIDDGQDFFVYEPELWDVAVSNPPFSLKMEIFKRMYSFGKPFAMLMNIMCLNYQEVGEFFLSRPLQLLIVDKKISFDGNTSSFNTSYFCSGLLPKDLMFAHMADNNSNKHFVPARMFEIENGIQKTGVEG